MSLSNQSVTSGFIDLATYDELENYLYNGKDAVAYFVRDTRRSTWFTQVPVPLSKSGGGEANFGSDFSVQISRAGDYLLSTWLRVEVPQVVANSFPLRWTRNFMHNLVEECCITFNDLVAARFDSYHLDFWSAFTTSGAKRTGYGNMIGNFADFTHPRKTLKATTLNLPLPFFFSRDTGVALPTAALPYNEMRITFRFRKWEDLLICDKGLVPTANTTTLSTTDPLSAPAAIGDISGNVAPKLGNVQVWANYAIVSNTERKKMACGPRDILIEQVQSAPKLSLNTQSVSQTDIRFSHAIKALFFAARNTTVSSSWSNYTTSQPGLDFDGTKGEGTVDYDAGDTYDPIARCSIVYENTQRLSGMGSDYFSLVNPYYHAPAIPEETGYHVYSYALDLYNLDPTGSTNFGKLTNVSIIPEASALAKSYAVAATAAQTTAYNAAQIWGAQTWDFICTAINMNVIRISGGALGFPVL